MYYGFFLNMWVYRSYEQVNETHMKIAVEKGYITQAEADQIMATPKQV